MSPWWRKPAQDEYQTPPGPGIVKSDSSDPILFGTTVFFLALTLAMIVTWFLVARYPIPEDDAIYTGLVFFFLIVFFSLPLIFRMVGPERRTGQRMLAVKWSFKLFGLSLLAASLVGVLPWLFKWLFNYSPWVFRIVQALFVLSLVAQCVLWAWRHRRARKSTRL